MNRRYTLPLAALGIMLAIAVLRSQQGPGSLLLLEWAGKASAQTPPKAVLIEFGLKDTRPTSWSGKAQLKGAKLVQREGFRFRDEDKLIEPDGWTITSHKPIRVPPAKPAVAALEGFATVGIVMHLADIQPGSTLTVSVKESGQADAVVPLDKLMSGKTQEIWEGNAAVRLVSTATPVATGKTEDDFPAAAYGPDGTLWVAYVSYHVTENQRRIEPPQLKEQPKEFKSYYTPEFGDQLFVKHYKGGKWSEPLQITGPKEDILRCAIAVEGNGDAWVIYSANRKGMHRLYARPISAKYAADGKPDSPAAGPEQMLPAPPAARRYLSPVACTAQDGSIWVACQKWLDDGAWMTGFKCTDGKWQEESFDFGYKGNAWHAAVAAGPGGEVMRAFDCYNRGDYDIILNRSGKDYRGNRPLLTSAQFEARPSLAYDAKGRLWIAYEVGPDKWGKDYGALDDQDGNPLYFARTIRVVCVDHGQLYQPLAELPPLAMRAKSPDTGQKVEAIPRYAYPTITVDAQGRVWLVYRVKFGSRYSSHPGSYWVSYARRLEGDHWSEPIEIHHSDGLLDHRPVLLPHPGGGLRIIHNTDGRYTTPDVIDNQIYMSYVDLPGEPGEPKLAAFAPADKSKEVTDRLAHEMAAVKRIRDHRIAAGGTQYHLLRGEFHRHTEISWDGGPDGSLEDMFRYGIDFAGMDWIGNGDHDNGGGREYVWWLTQKFTDAYHVPGVFAPMHSYERSVSYPHGHRNCIFAKRGVRTLPRLAESDPKKQVAGIHADDAKMLHRYLKELGGICAIHTSATSMGTDWRDNDPVAEPIVEIYQGDRMSYEKENAPRAGYDPATGVKPANIAGWFPLGFINHALDKGYRLGFQSSSDHFSTHISYCIVLAEKYDRQGILDAMKKRHVYGATDDIILDVRSGPHLMGDEFKTAQAPELEFKIIGTAPLAKVEILKNSEVVHKYEPGKKEFEGRWTDPKAAKGMNYYYVRVVQSDAEVAWGSPLWIEYSP